MEEQVLLVSYNLTFTVGKLSLEFVGGRKGQLLSIDKWSTVLQHGLPFDRFTNVTDNYIRISGLTYNYHTVRHVRFLQLLTESDTISNLNQV